MRNLPTTETQRGSVRDDSNTHILDDSFSVRNTQIALMKGFRQSRLSRLALQCDARIKGGRCSLYAKESGKSLLEFVPLYETR